MNTGGLIFAHNSSDLDYALMAVMSAGLAKKQLDIPFTLITDQATESWMKESNIFKIANNVFEKIAVLDNFKPSQNQRFLFDGAEGKHVPFINSSRSLAYDLTPYDRTLLIDSDYLIFSKSLKHFLQSDSPFMIPNAMHMLNGKNSKMLDRYVSPEGISLCWATTVIFDKDQENKIRFDLIKNIRDNYQLYADLYGFTNITQFRNDIAFSISGHIINGFTQDDSSNLPSLLTSIDSDILIDVNKSNLKFLVYNDTGDNRYTMCSVADTDVHVMNKQSIVRNKNKFLEII